MTLLSELTNGVMQFDNNGSPYTIRFDDTKALILRFGFSIKHAAVKKFLNHEKVAATLPAIHEFKHYRKNGSKFWTSKAGVDFFVVVPADQIEVKAVAGYSYPEVVINGETLRLNVGGGTNGKGWTDHVGKIPSTSVDHKLSTLTKVLEVALPPEVADLEPIQDVRESHIEKWRQIVARHTVKITEGMKLVLLKHFRYNGHYKYFIALSPYKGGKRWRTLFNPESEAIGGGLVQVEVSKVDHLATAEANGIVVPQPLDFKRVPQFS